MTEESMELIMEIAQQMIESGAEIGRVEESVNRMCSTYGTTPQVYATSSSIILTVYHPDGAFWTMTRRVKKSVSNMERLHHLNDLVRWITANAPSEEEIAQRLGKIKNISCYSTFSQLFCYALISSSFTVFFGARDGWEILFSALIGVSVGLASMGLDLLRCNSILSRFLCSFASSIAALVLFRLGWVPTVDNIIIGNIMAQIPGIGLTNALRDLLTGETITGLMRFMETVLLAIAIASGYWVYVFAIGGLL